MMNEERRKLRLVTAIGIVVPFSIVGLVWYPEVSHYRVSTPAISNQMIEAGKQEPLDAILEEIDKFDFLEHQWTNDGQIISSAEKLLIGVAEIPPYPPTTLHMPFDPSDLDGGEERWQLELGGFVVPDVLLHAYQLTGRDEFLLAAKDVILGWANYERKTTLPQGHLWNDHAIAERVTVLARFWRYYRRRKDFDPTVAHAIWGLASRCSEFLAKPSHFTYATNHGVIQNLALWHLCLAFPTLPQVDRYKQLAYDRLSQQMGYYLDSEGIVLEHSAGYHEFGLQLLSMALRYMTLLNLPVPKDWLRKFEGAKEFFAEIRRPDGTLPVIGDTDALGDQAGPETAHPDAAGRTSSLSLDTWIPAKHTAIYPISGYAVWWDGLSNWPDDQQLSQTVMTWSHFLGHGHKHADELSVVLWAAGQSWWTNVGYWPYGILGRNETESWPGADAPHLLGERQASQRQAKLLSSAEAGNVQAVEMERRGPGQYVANRLVLQYKPNLWVVIDSTTGSETQRTTTTWTTAENVVLSRGEADNSFVLQANTSSTKLQTFLLNSPGATVRTLRGSLEPFAGWQVTQQVPRGTSAILIEQPANHSWAVAVWQLEKGNSKILPHALPPRMRRWNGTRDWTLTLSLESSLLEVHREAEHLSFLTGGSAQRKEELILLPPPDVSGQVAGIQSNLAAVANQYPEYVELLKYRVRATYVLVVLLAAQELFFIAYRMRLWKYYSIARVVLLLAWAGGALWLYLSYFRVV